MAEGITCLLFFFSHMNHSFDKLTRAGWVNLRVSAKKNHFLRVAYAVTHWNTLPISLCQCG